jgi:hypothetical protein
MLKQRTPLDSGIGVAAMRAELDEQSVTSVSNQFWEQMLAIKLEPIPMAEIFCIGTRHLLGSVELSGV